MSDASHSRSACIDPARVSIAHIQRVEGGKDGVAFVANIVREIVLSGVAGLLPRRSAGTRKSSCGPADSGRCEVDARLLRESRPCRRAERVRTWRETHGLTSLATAKAGSHASRRITREL